MRGGARIAFAAVALTLAACQGGFDSGGSGMGGLGPPVGSQGAFGGGMTSMGAGGPTAGPNGVASLTHPGATLAPNQVQYPIADGPTGMKCPTVAGFGCSFSFNVPAPSRSPSPSPTGSPGKGKPTPTPSPTPTPTPTPSPSSSASAAATPTPTPTPAGQMTLQMEQLPTDVPAMLHPDFRALKVTPLVGLRLESDTDFVLDGTAIAKYTLPATQMPGRGFALQLYSENFAPTPGAKRADTFVATFANPTISGDSLTFTFAMPKLTVKRGAIWLLVLYGLNYPPNTTPTPSPTAGASSAASPSPSISPSGGPSPSSSASPSSSPAPTAAPPSPAPSVDRRA